MGLYFLWRVPMGIFLLVFLFGFLAGSSVVWSGKGCSFGNEQVQHPPPPVQLNSHRIGQ